MEGQNLFILKIEYFTNILPFGKEINYKKSASYYSSNLDLGDDKKVDPTQNLISDDNTIVYDYKERLSHEKELLKRLIPTLKNNKKVIFQNPNAIENVNSTMIRYVIYNGNLYFFIFRLEFRWKCLY